MIGNLARRVAKLEDRRRKRIRLPNVVGQFIGEARSEAIARLCARHGASLPPEHPILFVPQYRSRDEFAAEFKYQQTRLLAEVRNHRPHEEQAS